MSLSPISAASAADQHAPRTPVSALPSATDVKRRRRTLGRCAHCGTPVDVRDEYVRLYRRAWHLDCALAAEPIAARR